MRRKLQNSPRKVMRKRSPVRRGIGLAAMVGGICILAGLYYSTPPAGVRLELQVTQISFDVDAQNISGFFGALDTPVLYLSHFSKVELGSGSITSPSEKISEKGIIEAIRDDATATISPAVFSRVVPSNSNPVRVSVSWEEDEPGDVRVTLNSIETLFLSPPTRPLTLTCSSCFDAAETSRLVPLKFNPQGLIGHEIRLIPRDGSLRLGLEVKDPDRFRIEDVPVAGRLEFFQPGQIRPISSIRGGIVYPDVASELKIGSSLLKLQGLSNFRIDAIRLRTYGDVKVPGLEVRASGLASHLTVDGKEVLANLEGARP
jgi:hypothetical protein